MPKVRYFCYHLNHLTERKIIEAEHMVVPCALKSQSSLGGRS